MSDFCRFFHPPGSGYSADQQFIGATKKVSSYEYSGKFYDSGEFRLVMRTDRNLLKKLSFDTIIFYDGDTHIVEDIETHGDETILSGMDLKGILKRRKAVFNANIGYDGITGTTAECIEHYIKNNFTYAILEIFDMKTKDDYIIGREYHWMKVFQTKKFGMNN